MDQRNQIDCPFMDMNNEFSKRFEFLRPVYFANIGIDAGVGADG